MDMWKCVVWFFGWLVLVYAVVAGIVSVVIFAWLIKILFEDCWMLSCEETRNGLRNLSWWETKIPQNKYLAHLVYWTVGPIRNLLWSAFIGAIWPFILIMAIIIFWPSKEEKEEEREEEMGLR